MSVIMNVLNTVRRKNEAVSRQESSSTQSPSSFSTSSEWNSSASRSIPSGDVAVAPDPMNPINFEKSQLNSISFEPLLRILRSRRTWIVLAVFTAGLLLAVGIKGIVGWIQSSNDVSSSSSNGYKKVFQGTNSKPVLQGVILDEAEPYCLINGQIFKLGDEWQGKKITGISAKGVILVSKEDSLFLENQRAYAAKG